jgi:hypothetical protein
MPIVDLNYRKNQTTALTSTEVDRNFELVQDFTNGLETLYNTAFNQDGTFKVPVTATNIQSDSHFYAEDTSSNDDYAITLSPAITAYKDGMVVAFKAKTANTGAASLNVNSVGAKSIFKRKDIPLEDGDIIAGQIVEARYNSTTEGFEVTTPLSNQLGLKTGTKGQKIRVDDEGKIEFYTPTLASAEFSSHATPYWAGIKGQDLFGTDKEADSSLGTTTGTETQFSGDSNGGSNITGVELLFPDHAPGYPANNKANRYYETTFDDDKSATAGGVPIAETSGLMLLIQHYGFDSIFGSVNIFSPTIAAGGKYIPIYAHETGDWTTTGKGVHSAIVVCPRFDAHTYKFKIITSNAGDHYTAFKILGHY